MDFQATGFVGSIAKSIFNNAYDSEKSFFHSRLRNCQGAQSLTTLRHTESDWNIYCQSKARPGAGKNAINFHDKQFRLVFCFRIIHLRVPFVSNKGMSWIIYGLRLRTNKLFTSRVVVAGKAYSPARDFWESQLALYPVTPSREFWRLSYLMEWPESFAV